jgi:hypothetical protein
MYSSYFVFSIPNFSGTISSISLRLEHEFYESTASSEFVTVRDVSTSVSTLVNNTSPNQTIYQDLATGTTYGTLSGWSASTMGTIRTMTLSGAVTPVSNKRGSSFAIGVSISPQTSGTQRYIRFSLDTEARTHQLQIVVVP